MKILVTGGAGFIGSHLLEELLEQGHDLVVLDSFDAAYDPAIKERNISGLDLELIRGDIRDHATVTRAIRGVDVVVHLAARAGVRESLRSPLIYEEVNIRGTLVLLEALRDSPGTRLIFASSSSVYGARETGPFSELDSADRPVSPYAATKRSGELLCHAAHAGWGLQVNCLRFFTVYGPRQRPSMAISRFIRSVISGATLPMYGDGSSTRDYTWVGDAVSGIVAAIGGRQPFGVYNIGSGAPIRLDALIETIEDLVGREARIDRLPVQAGDVPMTYATIEHARDELGWTPQMQLRTGLQLTVDWAREELCLS